MRRSALLFAIVGLLTIGLDAIGGLAWLDQRLVELRMAAVPRAPTGTVVMVDVDASSLAAVGVWPWPRSVDAAILDRLTALGAGQVAFDIDFSAASDEAGDAVFEAALVRAGGNVILPSFRQNASALGAPVFTAPLPRFAASAWPAIVNVVPDGDGRVRSLPYGEAAGGAPLPSVAALLAGGTGSLGRDFLVDFSIDSRRIVHISAIDLIASRVAPGAVAGKTVIVGATAIELRDFFYVPVHGLVAGSVLQALGTETILQGRALGRTGDALALAALALVLAAAALVRLRWTTLIAAIVLAAVGVEVLALVVEARVPFILNTAPLRAGFALLVAATVLEEINARARRIAYLARFDTLTGLANRNQFLERLKRAESNDHAVVALRLDRFDEVCETFGHGVGDRLLCAVGGRIAPMLLPADCLARFGGEAFAVLVSGAGANARGKALARDLIARVGEPYALGAHRLIAALSLGIAPMVRGRDAETLLKQAETALHRAEASGGNALIAFDEAMVAGQSERQALEVELWEAFERNQFEVHYQPQVDLREGKICGVEALVRWQHPRRGTVLPDVIIPIAEAVGLIQPIGEWVLERACRDVARWPVALRLAVNVSPTQFARGDIVAAVKHALAVSGLPAQRLDIEITEAVFIRKPGTVATRIAELRGMGVGCALDDFGTGYSSLAYLRRFMIDKLKLDRSFVVGLPSNPDAMAIAQAVGALAQSFGLRLNAEGVERQEQIACLRLMGFTEGQGFLFGPPMREAELLARLRTGNAAAPQRSLAAG